MHREKYQRAVSHDSQRRHDLEAALKRPYVLGTDGHVALFPEQKGVAKLMHLQNVAHVSKKWRHGERRDKKNLRVQLGSDVQ